MATAYRARTASVAGGSLREPGLISDPKVNFSYFEIAIFTYGKSDQDFSHVRAPAD